MKPKHIQLSHGGGGDETNQLIRDLFFRHFNNDILAQEEDAARLSFNGDVAFTTDSFTVTPMFFNGGDLGKIAIAGTTNDLAMAGAKPEYLSCGFIIEEGLPIETLEKVVASMAAELQTNQAKIVCGDTKVVPKGAADGLFINTTGVGHCHSKPSWKELEAGDVLLISRDYGRHGACLLAEREGFDLSGAPDSDCASLWPTVEKLLAAGIQPVAMRDATRGGVAAVLNEWAHARQLGISVDESQLPVAPETQGVCELFGFEPLELANEGTFVLAVKPAQAEQALALLQSIQPSAARVGELVEAHAGKVVLTTPWNSKRYMEMPKGELLPRIC
ncbi:hydrogenase expression/formation protein HypE [Paraferrimonas sedimenticola]|uniref:Hydrogenase expression/formation protein HypE n=1 Tax=Paraferrimonas sedimenticola TaxID=375674 RepID=A0AA37W241_9GAMM|nr:hydrogenase expression/formation protein HypE [Paraferrimonas sedimenticola]GLP97303.1 hydrogenase expression/formation protein HypE [Paraferrimonas sedimenticola]